MCVSPTPISSYKNSQPHDLLSHKFPYFSALHSPTAVTRSMVTSAESPRRPPDPMASPPTPPPAQITAHSPLHRFSSFPILKKWGAQRVLRCVNVDRSSEAIGSLEPVQRSEDPIARSEPAEADAREERGGPMRTVRLRSDDHVRKERARFSVALTREEVDEDFYSLTGSRASRRPKKRPKIVQQQLDMLFPGLWLSEITAEAYKVPE